MRVHRLLDLEAHGRSETTAHELTLESEEEVLGVVLLDLKVLIARHAEGVVLHDFHAREELAEVRGDDVLEWYEALRPGDDEPLQDRRDFHSCEELRARAGVSHDDREVE